MNKPTINGQPDAQINAPANPQVRELRQGVVRQMINLETYMPPNFKELYAALHKLLRNHIGEDDEKYIAAITTLTQWFCGINDKITEIAIKGVNIDGEKYKIVIR